MQQDVFLFVGQSVTELYKTGERRTGQHMAANNRTGRTVRRATDGLE